MTGGRGGLSASGLVLLHVMYFIWAFGLWLRSAFAFAFWGHAATLGAGMLIGMLLRRPPPGGTLPLPRGEYPNTPSAMAMPDAREPLFNSVSQPGPLQPPVS